jgi:hypothetical protein
MKTLPGDFGGNGMYRLRDLKNGLYQIHVMDGAAFEGPVGPIFKKCVELGLRPAEVEEALCDLTRLNHDYAEFGVFRHYIFTAKDEKKKAA